MAIAAMVCLQFGLAIAVGLVDQLGAGGVAWIRLVWAAVIITLIARPWRIRYTRRALVVSSVLGVVTGGMTILFMFAVSLLPLGTAVALEFLGPLTVAVVRGRGRAKLWGLVAAAGVLALTEPWRGEIDPLGVCFALAAAVGWALYILLTQHAGDEADGLGALAISMPVAALVATVTVGPSSFGRFDLSLVLAGLGLAVMLPLIPFILELFALRRLTTAAFGTLTCLEPAVALGVGLVALGQVPGPLAAVGVVLVVVAGIGATRSGGRVPDDLPHAPTDDGIEGAHPHTSPIPHPDRLSSAVADATGAIDVIAHHAEDAPPSAPDGRSSTSHSSASRDGSCDADDDGTTRSRST